MHHALNAPLLQVWQIVNDYSVTTPPQPNPVQHQRDQVALRIAYISPIQLVRK